MSENNFVASTSSNQEEPRNKISRNKCFQEAWFEEFPSWKDWVVRLENETKFYCTILRQNNGMWQGTNFKT